MNLQVSPKPQSLNPYLMNLELRGGSSGRKDLRLRSVGAGGSVLGLAYRAQGLGV